MNYKIGDEYKLEGKKPLGTIIHVQPSFFAYINELRLVRLDGSIEYHSFFGIVPLNSTCSNSMYGDFAVKEPGEAPPDWWAGKYELEKPIQLTDR
jgi:hypothetical protein